MSTGTELEQYVPTIDAILSVADLEKITVKKIRLALQALFDVDLGADKKVVNDLIMGRYHNLVDERERRAALDADAGADADMDADADGADDLKASLEELAQKDKELAFKLQANINRRGLRVAPAKKVRKPKARVMTEEQKKNSPFMKPLKLSAKLAAFLDVDESETFPRPTLVKMIWEYIKAHGLQNENDKREILCDDRMKPIWGSKQTIFSLNKVLAQHVHKPDEE